MSSLLTGQTNDIIQRKGIFGFGFSNNEYMNLLNLAVLACAGVIIKIFFQDNYTKLGNRGPATTTIWGFGLTALSLFIMIFMSIHLSNNTKHLSNNTKHSLETKEDSTFIFFIKSIMNDTLPIVLTFIIIVYIIILNFIYFTRINSNKVTDTYTTYSFFSSALIIAQIFIIIKYMFSLIFIFNTKPKSVNNPSNNILNNAIEQHTIIKSFSFVLITINLIFVGIKHVLLAFYSTDG